MAPEFWNIPKGLITVFYGLAAVTIIVFVIGVWDKTSIWSRGRDVDQELKGKGSVGLIRLSITTFFSPDCLLAQRVFSRSILRGLMLMGIIWGFTALFAGTIGRTVNYWIFPFLEGGVWLSFSLVLDVAGASVLIGTGFALYRKYINKPERMVKSTADGMLLFLLFFVIFTGFCVEGIRIIVLNPPSADWSPVGYAFGGAIKVLVGENAWGALHQGAWVIHVLLAFFFIAYIPFSKYKHIFASQITTHLSKNKWKDKEIPRDWVFGEEIERRKKERLSQLSK